MKTMLNLYRRLYAIPEEATDRFVLSHFIVLLAFFFCLGFAVSQVIIFIMGK